MKLTCATTRLALKNVLMATDLSPMSETAVNYAAAIARRYDSKLFVTNVISPAETALIPPEYWGSTEQMIEEAAERQLRALGSRLQGVPHELLLERGGISEAISEVIDRFGIDLLVLATHGREGFDRFMMGSTAEDVFRRVACPVLTVGPGVTTRVPGEAEFKEIIFATNFGTESVAAAAYAISLAQEFQARLTLVNIATEQSNSIDPRQVVMDRINRLRELVPTDADLWCQPQCVVEFGKPAEQILNAAKERNADLIVLGAKSAGWPAGAATHVSAATAHTVVSHATCPVMTVRA
jgi:nucleotide-binding universal stress UspA family protein